MAVQADWLKQGDPVELMHSGVSSESIASPVTYTEWPGDALGDAWSQYQVPLISYDHEEGFARFIDLVVG